MPNPDTTDPWDRGRLAFWSGRELYGNPYTLDQAVSWREGWMHGQQEFTTRGGTERTAEALCQFRPRDVVAMKSYKKHTKRGAAKIHAANTRKRSAPAGWF